MTDETNSGVAPLSPTLVPAAQVAPADEPITAPAAPATSDVTDAIEAGSQIDPAVEAEMAASAKFLSTRSGTSNLDLEIDAPKIDVEISTVDKRQVFETVKGEDGKSIKVPKLDADGNEVYRNYKSAATVAVYIGDADIVSWEQASEAAYDLFGSSLVGKIYEGMKKKELAFRPGEAIDLVDIMRFFDVTSVSELVPLLVPKYKPKLSGSAKQAAALRQCAVGSEEETAPVHEWLETKLLDVILALANSSSKKPLSKKAEANLKNCAAFAVNFIIKGKMVGHKPEVDMLTNFNTLVSKMEDRLSRSLAELRKQAHGAVVSAEVQDRIERSELAIAGVKLYSCMASRLTSALIKFYAKAAEKAAKKATEDGTATANVVDPLDFI